MEEVLVFATILSPILTALLEALKRAINIDGKYIPLLSILVGMILGVLAFIFTDLGLAARLWAGAISGLGATGLFELGKGFLEDKK